MPDIFCVFSDSADTNPLQFSPDTKGAFSYRIFATVDVGIGKVIN